MVDYRSNYFKVAEIQNKTSQAVITQCKMQFACHGILEVLITDNGPEFSNQDFRYFATEYKFEHRMSSPMYPESNGKAENAVKTCKALLMKAKEDKKDPLLAILAWHNTAREGFGTSPVQRLMGRRTRTLLPTTKTLLQPHSDLTTARKLAAQKQLQCLQYDRDTRNVVPLKVGDGVRMRLPGKQT